MSDGGYAAARESASALPLEERGILAATGPQRAKFLHGVLSNDVESLTPGEARLAALMDTKGHVLALLRVAATPNALLLELPLARLGLVQQQLEHYRVAAPVRFAPRPGAVVAILGPRAGELANAAVASYPELLSFPAPDLPLGARVVYADAADAALQALGAAPLERAAFDALRVEAGRPLFGVDVGEDNLLHETGLVPEYHSTTKGCYVGQEVIARLEARGGHVNKLLRGLRLSAQVDAGAKIASGGRDVGRVTTPALSPRFGPVAMGYVHRSHMAPGTSVEVGNASGTVAALPLE